MTDTGTIVRTTEMVEDGTIIDLQATVAAIVIAAVEATGIHHMAIAEVDTVEVIAAIAAEAVVDEAAVAVGADSHSTEVWTIQATANRATTVLTHSIRCSANRYDTVPRSQSTCKCFGELSMMGNVSFRTHKFPFYALVYDNDVVVLHPSHFFFMRNVPYSLYSVVRELQ